jgi:hypothetical protein
LLNLLPPIKRLSSHSQKWPDALGNVICLYNESVWLHMSVLAYLEGWPQKSEEILGTFLKHKSWLLIHFDTYVQTWELVPFSQQNWKFSFFYERRNNIWIIRNHLHFTYRRQNGQVANMLYYGIIIDFQLLHSIQVVFILVTQEDDEVQ